MTTTAIPPFPGATAITHLKVYDSVAPDGLHSGTPHMHLVSTEAYVVTNGHGQVHTLGPDGFHIHPIERGEVVWFTPGIIHRLVNDDGHLEILVIMQNAGLPEAGDMVMTFPPEYLRDAESYRKHAALPVEDSTTDGPGVAARARRDLAVNGFVRLKEAFEDGDSEPLDNFYAAAARIVRPRVAEWRALCAAGPDALVAETTTQLDALERGDASHLQAAAVHTHAAPHGPRRMGCCGTLGIYNAGAPTT